MHPTRNVLTLRGPIVVALFVSAAVATLAGVQSPPPRVPPPPETSLHEILDLGAPPAAKCSCVPNPFALPSYHPGWGYGGGPAVPAEDAPLSDADRRANQEWYAQQDRMMRGASEQALAGNPAASLAAALHLSQRKAFFGPDDRVEEEAVHWLTFSAELGHTDAFRLLAHRYARGRGVAQDDATAAYWFDQGARRDDPISMTALGFLLAAGRGVAQNWPAAILWWQRAASRTPAASRYLGDAYACGAGVGEDRARALDAYTRFAERDASSSIQLGHMYVHGCAQTDAKAAVAAFRRAADRGYPDAQVELSDLLREGRGADANASEAYYWARLAERRLAPGALKTHADESARAAARLMSADEIAAGDDRVKVVMEAGAKPAR